jgi:hypothetical protein
MNAPQVLDEHGKRVSAPPGVALPHVVPLADLPAWSRVLHIDSHGHGIEQMDVGAGGANDDDNGLSRRSGDQRQEHHVSD